MNEKQCIKHPKVFISYSWTPESTKQKVQNIATRLSGFANLIETNVMNINEFNHKIIPVELKMHFNALLPANGRRDVSLLRLLYQSSDSVNN